MNGQYDESLAKQAPAPTQQQLQASYDPDILNRNHRTPTPTQSYPSNSKTDLEGHAYRTGPLAVNEQTLPNTPWWKTRPGKIAIGILVAVVIIAAVVGGAVGGTRKHSDPQPVPITSASPGETAPIGTDSVLSSLSGSATKSLPSFTFFTRPPSPSSTPDSASEQPGDGPPSSTSPAADSAGGEPGDNTDNGPQ